MRQMGIKAQWVKSYTQTTISPNDYEKQYLKKLEINVKDLES